MRVLGCRKRVNKCVMKQLRLIDLWPRKTDGRNIESDSVPIRHRSPSDVEQLVDYYNPSNIAFEPCPPYDYCGCGVECRVGDCSNSKAGVYCASNCCPYRGYCGNGLKRFPSVTIVQTESSFGYGVFADDHIDRGVIIGEYLGELKTFDACMKVGNRGYLLKMKASIKRAQPLPVFIDAERCGNMMRYLNHACDAPTVFEELSNGSRYTVVVTTRRKISRGEHITVNYGDRLWFTCQCGSLECCSRQ